MRRVPFCTISPNSGRFCWKSMNPIECAFINYKYMFCVLWDWCCLFRLFFICFHLCDVGANQRARSHKFWNLFFFGRWKHVFSNYSDKNPFVEFDTGRCLLTYYFLFCFIFLVLVFVSVFTFILLWRAFGWHWLRY